MLEAEIKNLYLQHDVKTIEHFKKSLIDLWKAKWLEISFPLVFQFL